MRRTKQILIGLAAILSLLGCYLSTQMLLQHTVGKSTGGLLQMVCGAGGGGCDKVSSSRWSVIPPRAKEPPISSAAAASSASPKELHIPVPVFGLFYFSALAAWFIGIGCPNELGRRWQLVPFLTILAGNAGSAGFLYLMARVIKAWCGGCLAIHVINFLLLVIVAISCLYRRRQAGTVPAHVAPAAPAVAHPSTRLALVTMTLALSLWLIGGMAAVSMGLYVEASLAKGVVAEVSRDPDVLAMMYSKREKHDIPVRPDDPSRGGPADAPVTLVVFADMTCPGCKRFEEFMTTGVQPVFGDRLRVVFKHFPLSSDCNRYSDSWRSAHSCPAAAAVEAARLQGGNEAFWKMHDLIRAASEDLASLDYRASATRLGLDPDRLVADMQSDPVRNRIREDTELANKLKVEGAPAVFLNGRPVPRVAQDKPAFWKLMAERLTDGRAAAGSATQPARTTTRQ